MIRAALTRFALVACAIAAAWASVPLSARQQPARDVVSSPTAGTAQIAGIVVSDDGKQRPLRRVLLALSPLSGGTGQPVMTTSNDEGRFAFTRLTPGNYSLRATRPGFVPVSYGEKRVGGSGMPITIVDGASVPVSLKLAAGAVITGAILDQRGKPMPQVTVRAVGIRVVNGVRTRVPVIATDSMTTDDRGIYRIYGLPAGTYVVSASPRLQVTGDVREVSTEELQWAQQRLKPGGAAMQMTAPPKPRQAVAYSPVFYPGTVDMAAAEVVTLASGEERSGLNFGVQFVPTAKLEGTIVGPDGQPLLNATVNVVSRADIGFDIESMLDMMSMRPVMTSGRFAIAGVRPGDYTIAVRAAPNTPGDPSASGRATGRAGGPSAAPMTLWGALDVAVAGVDQPDLAIVLQPGMTLSGRVVFDGILQPPADLSRVAIRLAAATTGTSVSVSVGAANPQVSPDGSFKIDGVTPGKYTVSVSVPSSGPPGMSWLPRSAIVRGVDALDVAFEMPRGQDLGDVVVTFTDKSGEVSGTVFDGAGRPTPDFSVLLFPADKAMWTNRSRRIRQPVRAGTDGKFKFASLSAGDYLIAVLTDYEPSEVYTAAFLEQVAAAGAMKITVAEGEKKVQDLKISGLGGH